MRRGTLPASVLVAAARRFLGVFAGAAGVAAFLGLLFGLITNDGVRRGIALGFYLVGVMLCVTGVIIGTRPPVRSRDGGRMPWLSSRGVRWATREEHQESMNLPALLVVIGVLLVPIGVAFDTRH